ncbi:hypothetical protein HDV06_005225 [Boothiomyces sp. JEL0866]|nr:hypothetical protein HDV06_005225 [Boothiomyces sp. JEL0866]
MTECEYKLEIRQTPKTGRETGTTKPYLKSLIKTREELESLNYFCHLVLLSADGKEIQTLIKNSIYSKSMYTVNFTGDTMMSGQVLNDPVDGEPYIFFVFPEMAIRVPGEYSILCRVQNMANMDDTIQEITTVPFKVYHHDQYVKPSKTTQLTKSFLIQGVRSFGICQMLKKQVED